MHVLSVIHRHWLTPFVVVVFGMGAVGLGWFLPALDNARNAVSKLSLERAHQVRAEMEYSFGLLYSELEAHATLIAYDPEKTEEALLRVVSRHAAIVSSALIDPTGQQLHSSIKEGMAEKIPPLPYPYANETYAQAALRGARGVSTVHYGPMGDPFIYLAVPILTEGAVTGILVADVALSQMLNKNLLAHNEVHEFLTDEKGRVIIHPNMELVRDRHTMLAVPAVQKVLIARETVTGASSDDEYVDSTGTIMLLSGIPASRGWGVFVEQPRASALAAQRTIILLALSFCLLALASFLVMWRRQRELEKVNRRINVLLRENQQSARLLVQKDRELRESNETLERANGDLQETARVLIRRDIELSSANERLEGLDTIKSEFVTIAAHQLRTPLTGVRWSLKGLSSGEYGALSSDQQRVTDTALSAIVGAINLINDLLNVARIEGGRFGFSFADVSISAVVRSALSGVTAGASKKRIILNANLPQESVHVFGDAERLALAMSHIIENAVRYTNPGGAVSVNGVVEEGLIKISVTDTGIGVPASDKHLLFTKFFRAQNAMLLETSGSGLGLYLVKNIVEKHKGTVSAADNPAGGTIITVTLPLSTRQSAK